MTRKCKVWRQTLDLNTTRYWMDMRWMDDDMLVLAVVWMDVDVGGGTVQLDASAIEPDFFLFREPQWCQFRNRHLFLFTSVLPWWCRLGKPIPKGHRRPSL